MKFRKIGSRGLLFPFTDPFPTNVYVIIGHERIYVLDTFLGSESMALVKEGLESEGHEGKPIVVFNSHGDFDHYWGNSAFEGALIIGHEECRTRILAESDEALLVNKERKKGEVVVRAPSLVFENRLSFPDDGLTFFHTPGHTIDSSSCYDETDRILFVGDNVESPLPYVYNTNVVQYIETLKSYLDLDWDVMIASHDPPLHDKTLLEKNIKYLTDLQSWKIDIASLTEGELHQHINNIKYLEDNINDSQLTKEARQHFDDMKKVEHH